MTRQALPRARATVVVVSWNGAALLPGCLGSLAAQDLPPQDFRVLVVDNASEDGTDRVLSRFPDVDVVRLPVNRGFAGGVAAALGLVDTEYVALLNNDAMASPSWLRELLAPLDSDPSVVATTSKVLLASDYHVVVPPPGAIRSVNLAGQEVIDGCLLNANGELLVPTGGTTEAPGSGSARAEPLEIRFADGRAGWSREVDPAAGVPVVNSVGLVLTRGLRGADRGYLEPDRGQFDEVCEVLGFCGGAAALRVSAVRRAGGMDPYLFLYGEDLDLSWRLRRCGGRILFVPRARVRHLHGESSRLGSEGFFYFNLRNRFLVLVANATPGELVRAVMASAVSLGRRGLPVRGARQGLSIAGSRGRPSMRLMLRACRGIARGLPHAAARRYRRSGAG